MPVVVMTQIDTLPIITETCGKCQHGGIRV